MPSGEFQSLEIWLLRSVDMGAPCTPEVDAHKAGVEVRMRVFVPGF